MNNISRKFCQFSSNYLDALQSSFNEDIFIKVEKLALHLREAWKEGKNIYICGNGGSGANAIHLANDLHYGAGACGGGPVVKGLKVEALTANSAVLTCLGNDIGYDMIFSHILTKVYLLVSLIFHKYVLVHNQFL